MNSKIYRCGWCGHPTDKEGNPLKDGDFKKVVNLIENYKSDDHTHLEHGYCCIQEQSSKERMRVTRDMAIDAGDMSLEGQFI